MKKILNLIFLLLLLLACNNNKKALVEKNTSIEEVNQEKLVTKVVFYENNTSVPANFELHKYNQIEITKDSASLIEYILKNGDLSETNTLKSIRLNETQKAIFFSLPNEYLKNDEYSIGNPSSLSEDKFKATITLNNNKKIIWKMDYNEKRIPKEIQPFYQLYFETKQKLY